MRPSHDVGLDQRPRRVADRRRPAWPARRTRARRRPRPRRCAGSRGWRRRPAARGRRSRTRRPRRPCGRRGNVSALSRWLKRLDLAGLGARAARAMPPAASTAFQGSVSSTCSTPSGATRNATRLPESCLGCHRIRSSRSVTEPPGATRRAGSFTGRTARGSAKYMGYAIAAIVVLLLVAGFVTFFALNAAAPTRAARRPAIRAARARRPASPRPTSRRSATPPRSPRPARPRAGTPAGTRTRARAPDRPRVGDPGPEAPTVLAERCLRSDGHGGYPLRRASADALHSSASRARRTLLLISRGAHGAPVALSGLAGSPVVVTAPGIPAPGPPGPVPEPPAPAPPGPGSRPAPADARSRAGTAAAGPEPAADLTCDPSRRRRPRRRTTRC